LYRNDIQDLHQQFLFANVRCGHFQTQRQAAVVHDYLEFHALANLGFSHYVAPFFARMKVASASNSSKSNLPSSSSSSIRTAWISGSTPSPAHSCSLRQQVLPEGRSKGIACQGEPVRSNQRIPSKH